MPSPTRSYYQSQDSGLVEMKQFHTCNGYNRKVYWAKPINIYHYEKKKRSCYKDRTILLCPGKLNAASISQRENEKKMCTLSYSSCIEQVTREIKIVYNSASLKFLLSIFTSYNKIFLSLVKPNHRMTYYHDMLCF